MDNNISFDDAAYESIVTAPTLVLEDITGNGITNQQVNFKLKISFKENKFKIVASDFIYHGIDVRGTHNEALESLKFKGYISSPVSKVAKRFDDSFMAFLKSLKASIASKKDDNW